MRRKTSGRREHPTKEADEGTVRALRKADRSSGDGSAPEDGTSGRDGAGAWIGSRGASSSSSSTLERGTDLGNGLAPALKEETITPAELASIPSVPVAPSSSGAEAATAALEQSGGGTTQSSGVELAATPDPEGIIELAESGLGLLCLFFARRAPARLEDPAHFSESERAMLRIFAPAAAPYLGSAASQAPQVSALAFVGCLGAILWGRYGALRSEQKEAAAKEAAAPKMSAAPVSRVPTADDRIEHSKRWGPAADAVPVGALPKDAGLPPRFRPDPNGRLSA